jgi:hypothetical protein
MAPGADGLWGTADDVIDASGNPNPVMPPATVQPVGASAPVCAAAGSLNGRITWSEDLGQGRCVDRPPRATRRSDPIALQLLVGFGPPYRMKTSGTGSVGNLKLPRCEWLRSLRSFGRT